MLIMLLLVLPLLPPLCRDTPCRQGHYLAILPMADLAQLFTNSMTLLLQQTLELVQDQVQRKSQSISIIKRLRLKALVAERLVHTEHLPGIKLDLAPHGVMGIILKTAFSLLIF